MATEIENDSPLLPLVFLAVALVVFLGAGLELAYLGGVFTGKSEVIANDQPIAKEVSQKASTP
jgi:hypothetical protein